jgi:hypothetical protein
VQNWGSLLQSNLCHDDFSLKMAIAEELSFPEILLCEPGVALHGVGGHSRFAFRAKQELKSCGIGIDNLDIPFDNAATVLPF